MTRFVADENLSGAVIRALMRRNVDIQRVQDVGLRGETDEVVLQWSAEAGRVLVTHDHATLIGLAYDRIRDLQPMAGVIAVAQSLSTGAIVSDLELIARCSEPEEWRDCVSYLPLK